MLEYVLEDNEQTTEPGDQRAQVINVRSYSTKELTSRIMQIGAGLTRSDITSVLEAVKQVIAAIIAEGGAVHFELFNAYPSIQGVFTSPEDSFDPSRHKIRINLHAGTALRGAVAAIKTKKVTAVVTGTIITGVTDIKSGSVNETLTPGYNVKISGAKLKISGEDPEVGLYFVPAGGAGTPIMVDPADIVINNPSELIAVIPPSLITDTYLLRIVTQYSGGKALKRPHTVTFDKLLTVP
jgi:hypothetical protein